MRPGELIAAAGGAVLLIAMLLPWYTRDTEVAGVLFSESWNAWQSVPPVAMLLFVVGVAAIGLPLARALAAPGLRTDRLLTALGLLAVGLMLIRLIDVPIAEIDPQSGDRVDTGRGPALLLALLATTAIAFGGRVRAPWQR